MAQAERRANTFALFSKEKSSGNACKSSCQNEIAFATGLVRVGGCIVFAKTAVYVLVLLM